MDPNNLGSHMVIGKHLDPSTLVLTNTISQPRMGKMDSINIQRPRHMKTIMQKQETIVPSQIDRMIKNAPGLHNDMSDYDSETDQFEESSSSEHSEEEIKESSGSVSSKEESKIESSSSLSE